MNKSIDTILCYFNSHKMEHIKLDEPIFGCYEKWTCRICGKTTVNINDQVIDIKHLENDK